MTIHDLVPWLNEAQSRGEIFRPHSQPHFTGPRAYAFGLPKIATKTRDVEWIPVRYMENG